MEMLELGQGCGDGNGTWTTLAVRKGTERRRTLW